MIINFQNSTFKIHEKSKKKLNCNLFILHNLKTSIHVIGKILNFKAIFCCIFYYRKTLGLKELTLEMR